MSIFDYVNVREAEAMVAKLYEDGGELSQHAAEVVMALLDGMVEHDRGRVTQQSKSFEPA